MFSYQLLIITEERKAHQERMEVDIEVNQERAKNI
jgi:hypothetical protein